MTIQAGIGIGQQAGVAFGALYAEVQQFYARQMQLLDLGEAEGWAGTFTEDALFDVPTLPEPARGRAALAAACDRSAAQLAQAGLRHRHFMGMFDVAERADGAVAVRSYAIVYESAVGGSSRVHRVCVCEDVLVRSGGALRVASRRVTRDDLP
ncbi:MULTISPECIES: nuclear transport factor 2 family protein [unclassified Streptomyces]|uniref:nuclear transport factor 2 family protein n=1 Tax=unclassified Streptomyces TaxID=2593676 RepID=UPI0033E08DCF